MKAEATGMVGNTEAVEVPSMPAKDTKQHVDNPPIMRLRLPPLLHIFDPWRVTSSNGT